MVSALLQLCNEDLYCDKLQDLEYVVPVTIGTPGVTLNLDFDTGVSPCPFSLI